MPLSKEQKEQVVSHLVDKGVGTCPSCGAGREAMTLGPDSVALYTTEGTEIQETNAVLLVGLVCQNCGHLRLFHAHTVGLDLE